VSIKKLWKGLYLCLLIHDISILYLVPSTRYRRNNGLVATSYQVVISHKRAAGGGQQGITV